MQPWTFTTPEQVVFRRHAAGMGSRAAAWALDQVIILGLFILIVSAIAGLGGAGEAAHGVVVALVVLIKFMLDFGYSVWFELFRSGQTPGKKALGLRVISAHGGALLPESCMLRSVARVLDSPLPFFAPLALLVMALDPWHRRMGDFLGGTLVVADVRAAAPAALEAARQRHNSYAGDAAVKARVLSRATREERDLLADLLDRRDALDPAARDALFSRAFAHFSARYALPEQAHLSDEQAVLNLALIVLGETFAG